MLMFMVNERSLASRVEAQCSTRQARLRLKIPCYFKTRMGTQGRKIYPQHDNPTWRMTLQMVLSSKARL